VKKVNVKAVPCCPASLKVTTRISQSDEIPGSDKCVTTTVRPNKVTLGSVAVGMSACWPTARGRPSPPSSSYPYDA